MTAQPSGLVDLEYSYLPVPASTVQVVFLNGFRMNYSTWDKVYPEIAEHHSVLLYNRLGVGKSPRASSGQDGNTVVSSFQNLLQATGVSGPLVLVAHSLGGVYGNLFARCYPDKVAAVVFVDSGHPEESQAQKQFKPPALFSALNNLLKKVEKRFDPWRYSEDECMMQTLDQINTAGDFPDVPVAVVSGTKKMPFVPEAAMKMHLSYQEKLMRLSNQSTRYICHDSGHFPQISQSDLVVKAILETIKKL